MLIISNGMIKNNIKSNKFQLNNAYFTKDQKMTPKIMIQNDN